MTKMSTRSSARQAQNNQINLNHEDLSQRSKRQAKESKHVVSNGDNEDTTLRKLPKTRRTAKLDSVCSNDDSKTECQSLSSEKEHLLKNNLSKNKMSRCLLKHDIVPCNYSDDECGKELTVILLSPRKQKSQNSVRDLHEISCASPPKQKKVTGVNLLQTPRHKKNDETKEVQTPSSLLAKLKLTSPAHSNSVVRNKLVSSNRKQLFKEVNEKNIFPDSDEEYHEKNVEKSMNVYQNARKALHSTFPTDMPSREKELSELRDFIKTHVGNRTSGSLYVSGPPGTGKTACLNIILQDDNISCELRKVYVNCTGIKSATAIYSRIAKELEIRVNGKAEKDYLAAVEKYIKKQDKMILLVLDEIDQLESKNQSILYTIFEWPSKPNCQLILVGIANALDLTDRILPRLQARCELKPTLMHFPPYSKQQIVEIFTSRLKSAGVLEVFSTVALQMLAGKVAAVSGDVRRALDIGRRVVELVDQSKGEEILKPIENLANRLVDKEEKKSEHKLKTVELKQVVNVLNNIYGTSQNLTDDAEETFPLQQKIIICSLILMLKKARNKDITIGKLHEVYKRVCSKRNIQSVDQAEFVGLCSLIETSGIIRVSGKKEPRLHKVNLEWDEGEVAAALKDKQLMSMILQDESCLGKM